MVALPHWLTLLILLSASSLGAVLAASSLRRIPCLTVENSLRRQPLLFAAICAPALVVAIGYIPPTRLDEWLWYLPLWLHYWAVGLMWTYFGALTAFLGAYTATLAYKTKHRQRNEAALGSIVMLVAVLLPQWTFTRPVAKDLYDNSTRDGIVFQSSGVSCAAASGANIARLLGLRDVDERMAALAMGTTRMGTTMPQAVKGMRTLGIECTPTRISPPEIDRLATPAFLYIDYPGVGRNGHAIALVTQESNGRYLIIDPLGGKASWSRDQLLEIWHGLSVSCTRKK